MAINPKSVINDEKPTWLQAIMDTIGNLWVRGRRRYAHMKIRSKFTAVFIMVMLISNLVVVFVVTHLAEKVFVDYSVEMTHNIVSQIGRNTRSFVVEYEAITYNISQNHKLKEILYKNQSEIELFEKTIMQKNINTYINSDIQSATYTKRVIIAANNGEFYWWQRDENSVPESQIELFFSKILDENFNKNNKILWVETTVYEDEVYLIRPIIDEENITQVLGYMLFAIPKNISQLVTDEGLSHMIGTENVAVVNDASDTFFDTELINRSLQIRLLESGDYKLNQTNHLFVTMKGQRYLLMEKYFAGDWKVIVMVSQEVFQEGIQDIQRSIYGIGLLTLLAATLVAYFSARNITQNIQLLEENIVKVEAGDFSARVKPKSYDEIGLVGLRFNYMSNQIQKLIDQLYDSEAEKQKIEQEVLKAQINPHFMYNTLGTIKWMADSKGQEDISAMVVSLIELLKLSIKQKDTFLTLEEEMSYIENYMKIQVESMDGEIHLAYEIQPDTRQLYVLNFMLQPIVENAIYHGLVLRKGRNTIILRSYIHGEDLILKVIDNGKGMTVEQMEAILKEPKKKKKGFNSIGIRNVNERIRIYFGQGYGLSYASRLGQGTTVTFRLPIVASKAGKEVDHESNGSR